jgi:membrane protease YdiL (CAAX protease family)
MALFFVLAYVLMWACFVPVAMGVVPKPLQGTVIVLGAFAPAVAALFVTWRSAGDAGVRSSLGRVLQGPVQARWVFFAALYMVTVKLTVAVLHRLLLGAWPRFGHEPWYFISFAIAFSLPFQAGEEIGWRGFALPRLAARLGLGPASLLLGVIWGLWHLPQFFIRDADTFQQSLWVYALQVVAISVAMAWLYAKVQGSLWPLMLLHSAVNNSKDIVPSAAPNGGGVFGFQASPVGWLTLGVLWLGAVFFLVRMPGAEHIQPRLAEGQSLRG